MSLDPDRSAASSQIDAEAETQSRVAPAAEAFSSSATVKDDGREYKGLDEIQSWLAQTSTEFSYVRTLTSADRLDANTWLVTNHLEGNFPGGVVDLRYRFVLDGGVIATLEIAA